MAPSVADRRPPPVAVFLDRDGVINRRAADGGYVRDWSEFEFLPGAVAALAELRTAGAALIVVTNQRGVARGLVEPSALDDIHRRMADRLSAAGAELSGIYVCPHRAGTCDCRKPDIGLFVQAQAALPWIVFTAAHLVGDSLADLRAGARLGMTQWLVGDERADVARAASDEGIEVSGSYASLAELVAAGVLTHLLAATPGAV
jgi:histidinol-phosphate phosphatase family protein